MLFDISVGYDLAGIRSAKVTQFLKDMLDASRLIEAQRQHLRRELPQDLAHLADIPVPPCIGNCVTLSTFHGCPPEEIEAICTHLLEEIGVHVVVKMNPTLLGYERVRDILNGTLGYTHIPVHQPAFEHDASFEEGIDLIRRIHSVGQRCNRMVGAKFTNTLVVENHRSFFPKSEEVMYLSGTPLYVLSTNLAADFRAKVGLPLTVSFSAGIDAKNYPDAIAAGLTPVTTCSDLLKPGGYGRLAGYHKALADRMKAVGAHTIEQFILGEDQRHNNHERSAAQAHESSSEELRKAALRNHQRSATAALSDPRYRATKNAKAPRKIGSHLQIFNCVNCDKCIPVCPNNANFSYSVPPRVVRYRDYVVHEGRVQPQGSESTLSLGGPKTSPHQLANIADLCNDCGNCDIFCPEDGGPYIEKPRFFLSLSAFEADTKPGFVLLREGAQLVMRGRWQGYSVQLTP